MGPGIYGGVVRRDAEGEIVIGDQYQGNDQSMILDFKSYLNQGHNPKPGPVYAGGGYTPVNQALKEDTRLAQLLDTWPDLVNDISTGQEQTYYVSHKNCHCVTSGGAQPLHMAGMSRANQTSVQRLVEAGADIEVIIIIAFITIVIIYIEALDTYGFTPLLRMASNNLASGARALLEAGAHPRYKGGCGLSPLQCAKQSAAK